MNQYATDETVPVDRLVLERVPLNTRIWISSVALNRSLVKASILIDRLTGDAAINLTRELMGARIGQSSVSYPADWWQALKQRWAPRWFLARWPVRITTYDLEAHLTYPAVRVQGKRGPIVFQFHRRDSTS